MAVEFNGFEEAADDFSEIADQAREARDDLPGALDEQMGEAAQLGATFASDEAPVDTGNLAENIESAKRDLLRWAIQTDVPYAEWVEKGTDPHPIEADKADLLHFETDGQHIATESVQHPGTDPDRFMQRAINRLRGPYRQTLAETAEGVLTDAFD